MFIIHLYIFTTYLKLFHYLGIILSFRSMSTSGVIANSIRSKLQNILQTKHLEIINESYMHNVPKDAETHFKVVIVTDKFDGLALIKVGYWVFLANLLVYFLFLTLYILKSNIYNFIFTLTVLHKYFDYLFNIHLYILKNMILCKDI